MSKIYNNVKVLHLATHDYGGAGLASISINDEISQIVNRSVLVVKEKRSNNDNVIEYRQVFLLIGFIEKLLFKVRKYKTKRKFFENGFTNRIIFSQNQSLAKVVRIIKQIGFNPDVIFLHWITDFLSVQDIYKLHKITDAKIIWLMMDNAPFTGGCHYPFECTEYQNECRNCPMFSSNFDFPSILLKQKKTLLPQALEFWGSTSDCNRAKFSTAVGTRLVKPILSIIDRTVFNPENKENARAFFQIDPDQFVIFFGATNISEERKGFDYLVSILTTLKERNKRLFSNTTLLIAGGGMDSQIFHHLGYSVHLTGRLNSVELAMAYKAANCYLCTSTEDSGPLMVNQSIACGTPVIAFDLGVAKDLIENGITGYRVSLGNVEGMYGSIELLFNLNGDERNVISNFCHSIYTSRYNEIGISNEFKSMLGLL